MVTTCCTFAIRFFFQFFNYYYYNYTISIAYLCRIFYFKQEIELDYCVSPNFKRE